METNNYTKPEMRTIAIAMEQTILAGSDLLDRDNTGGLGGSLGPNEDWD